MVFYYIFITLILSVTIVYIGSTISDYTDNKNVKMMINWFSLLAILNVMIMMFIFATYNTLRFKKGPSGPAGKRGIIGSTGKDGSCTMCAPAINGLRPIRPLNKIDYPDSMDPTDEKEELFSRDENNTNLGNKVHQYINDLYIQTFDYVNKLGYDLGLEYNIRQGFAKYYGLKLSNELNKNRKKFNIKTLQLLSNDIHNKLNSNKSDIEFQIQQIRGKNKNDQNKYIEHILNKEIYGHDV